MTRAEEIALCGHAADCRLIDESIPVAYPAWLDNCTCGRELLLASRCANPETELTRARLLRLPLDAPELPSGLHLVGAHFVDTDGVGWHTRVRRAPPQGEYTAGIDRMTRERAV